MRKHFPSVPLLGRLPGVFAGFASPPAAAPSKETREEVALDGFAAWLAAGRAAASSQAEAPVGAIGQAQEGSAAAASRGAAAAQHPPALRGGSSAQGEPSEVRAFALDSAAAGAPQGGSEPHACSQQASSAPALPGEDGSRLRAPAQAPVSVVEVSLDAWALQRPESACTPQKQREAARCTAPEGETPASKLQQPPPQEAPAAVQPASPVVVRNPKQQDQAPAPDEAEAVQPQPLPLAEQEVQEAAATTGAQAAQPHPAEGPAAAEGNASPPAGGSSSSSSSSGSGSSSSSSSSSDDEDSSRSAGGSAANRRGAPANRAASDMDVSSGRRSPAAGAKRPAGDELAERAEPAKRQKSGSLAAGVCAVVSHQNPPCMRAVLGNT